MTPKNPLTQSKLANLGSYHRLDLTLSKTIVKGHGELMVGVSDLFNKTNQAVCETATATGHDTPGRTFFARLQLRF